MGIIIYYIYFMKSNIGSNPQVLISPTSPSKLEDRTLSSAMAQLNVPNINKPPPTNRNDILKIIANNIMSIDLKSIIDELGLTKNEIIKKELKSFKENNKDTNLCQLRYDHYEERRQAKIDMIYRRWTVLWELQNNKSKTVAKTVSSENLSKNKSNTQFGIRSTNTSRCENRKAMSSTMTENKTRSLINYNKERHKFVRENNANNALQREAKFNL